MDNRDSPSATARIFWKLLNLPRRSRKPEPEPVLSVRSRILTERAQVQQDRGRHLEPELEIRKLPPRKRTLSVSSSYRAENARQTLLTEQQTASLLFKLPKELRLMIYEHVLGGMVLHIVRRKAKLGHTLCKTRADPEQCTLDRCRGYKIPSGFHTGRGNGQLVQILQTCRKV